MGMIVEEPTATGSFMATSAADDAGLKCEPGPVDAV